MTALRISLALLAIGLGVAFAWMTDWGRDIVDGPEIAAKKASGKTESATVLPDFKLGSDASTYAQIVDRPLLNPTRKPAPTQAIAVVAPEPPKPQIRRGLYQLIGVADYGSVRVAQVRESSSNKVRSVREGETLQELTVRRIESTRMTLEFQGETDVVELAKFTASGRVPLPAPPPTPPPTMAAAQDQPPPNPVSAVPPAVPAQPPRTLSQVTGPAAADQALPQGGTINRRTGALVTPGPAREVMNAAEAPQAPASPARRRLAREASGQQ